MSRKIFAGNEKIFPAERRNNVDYLTVKEVAELKSCSERYIKQLCKDGKFETKQEMNSKGRMKYMIPVTALPEDLQAKYYKQKRTETGIMPEKIESENGSAKALKYGCKGIKKPFQEFSETERETIQFWINLLTEWQAERSGRKDKTEFDKIFVAHQKYISPDIEISISILYRKYSAYQNECYTDLIDKRGGWNKGKSKLDDDSIIWQAFLSLYLDDSEPKIADCYKKMTAFIAEEHPELIFQIPSVDTFRRKIKKIPFAVLEYSHKGKKAMHDHCLPYADRLTDNLLANRVWVMDNYTLDVLVKNEDGVTATKRIYLTGVLDAKSFVLVGWNISTSPDSQSTLIALKNAILRHGCPVELYLDNGREFTAKDLSDCRGSRKMSDEEFPVSIFERLEIKVTFAKPRNAQAKAIERAHLTFKNQFCRGLDGWCGGNILERRESLKRHIKNGIIETEPEIRSFFKEYIECVYNIGEYGGSDPKYQGCSKIDVWNKSIQNTSLKVYKPDTLNLLMMRTKGYQKIRREGVFVPYQSEKIWYYDKNITWKHINEEVCVRYDPCDLRQVRIYDKDDRYLFSWQCADWLMTEYIDEESSKIAEIERVKKITAKNIAERASQLKGELHITRKSGIKYQIKQGKGKFEIRLPKNINVVTTEETMEQAVGAETQTVEINLKKIALNGARRKENNYD